MTCAVGVAGLEVGLECGAGSARGGAGFALVSVLVEEKKSFLRGVVESAGPDVADSHAAFEAGDGV